MDMDMKLDSEIVKDGDYIIVKRQHYAKILKVAGTRCSTMLGRDEIDLTPVIGERYWTTYKLERKEFSKRLYTLKKCKREISFTDGIIKDVRSGVDNREINDDGLSQKLSAEEILNLRARGMSGPEIVVQLVENSRTFSNKTEFSQEKYLRKKEKKYNEYVTVRKPTLRMILDIFLKQPSRTLGLRVDTIAQIVSLANVRSNGVYLLYENGCNGMIAAALMDRLENDGFVIHAHSGVNEHPSMPVLALNMSKEKLSHLMSINIRRLAGKPSDPDPQPETSGNRDHEVGNKRKTGQCEGGQSCKKRRLEAEDKVMEFLGKQKADAIIICGREHPINIFRVMSKYLDISRPFVAYCPVREPLQQMYCDLKLRSDVLSIRITESFLRGYQVLPERTHPSINTSGTGGYLLSGILANLKINFMKNLKLYMKNSSVHGLKHIIDEEAHWLEKLFWVCVCISCIYGTIIVFIASWTSYKESPVSFVVETTYLDWNTTFPAVTVCEKRNADKIESFSEKFFGKDRNLNLDTFLGDITFFTGVCSSCVYHCGTDIVCPENLTFITGMIRSQCKNILKDCKWNDQEFDCCTEFEPIHTGSGECYTINSMQGERWGLTERSINLTSNRITGPGTLTFRAVEDVIIAIHSPEDILFSHGSPDQFSMVEYGQIMEMNFQVVEIVNDVNVRDISVQSRDCRFPDENPLTVYPFYSYSACMTECEGNTQVELCGCTHHLMPKKFLARHTVCNISGLTCINNHKEILKTVKGLWSDKPGLTCNCPSSCTEQEFKVLQLRVSDVEYEEDEGGDNSSVEADYSLKATIAMASLPTERFSRNVVRTRLDIVVSMGGTAGLFLGASLLSIVEILYYFLIRKSGGSPKKAPRKIPYKKKKRIHITDYRSNNWKKVIPRDDLFLW